MPAWTWPSVAGGGDGSAERPIAATPAYDADRQPGRASPGRCARPGVPARPDRVHPTVHGARPPRRRAARPTSTGPAGSPCAAARTTSPATTGAFAAYFGGPAARRSRGGAGCTAQLRLVAGPATSGSPATVPTRRTRRAAAAASSVEVLRHRDLADADAGRAGGAAAADRGDARCRGEPRGHPAAAAGAARRGRPAAARVRACCAAAASRCGCATAPGTRGRAGVVLLVDVSGSMEPYADALLRFAHAAARRGRGPRPRCSRIGTRLTRVTREMRGRDPDAALAAVAAAVPDWSGGTRLGELLKAFLDRWGQRGMARGAVVVVLSDGWERGDADAARRADAPAAPAGAPRGLGQPRKAAPGYAPLAAGMAAALPHVDDFVDGHSLAALERLAAVVLGGPVHGEGAAVRDIARRAARAGATRRAASRWPPSSARAAARRAQPGAAMAVAPTASRRQRLRRLRRGRGLRAGPGGARPARRGRRRATASATTTRSPSG